MTSTRPCAAPDCEKLIARWDRKRYCSPACRQKAHRTRQAKAQQPNTAIVTNSHNRHDTTKSTLRVTLEFDYAEYQAIIRKAKTLKHVPTFIRRSHSRRPRRKNGRTKNTRHNHREKAQNRKETERDKSPLSDRKASTRPKPRPSTPTPESRSMSVSRSQPGERP